MPRRTPFFSIRPGEQDHGKGDDDPWIHPVILAGIAQHRLAWIHPFVDGNGRSARMLTTLLRLQEWLTCFLGGFSYQWCESRSWRVAAFELPASPVHPHGGIQITPPAKSTRTRDRLGA